MYRLTAAVLPLVILAGVVLATSSASATVKPKLEDMVARSTWVVVATVTDAQNPDGDERTVTLKPKRLLKGELPQLPGSFVVKYQRVGKGNIDFAALKKRGDDQVFFLRVVPDQPERAATFHLELTDAWFGVEPATREVIERIHPAKK